MGDVREGKGGQLFRGVSGDAAQGLVYAFKLKVERNNGGADRRLVESPLKVLFLVSSSRFAFSSSMVRTETFFLELTVRLP